MSQFYRVAASAALGLGHFAHRHSEAVGVCLGDLQTSREGVATNPEGQGEGTEGEDQAGHGSSRLVDAVILQGHGLVALQECAVHPLSHAAVAIDHQAQHVTAAAVVTRHAARVPLYNGGTGERRQDDTLTGRARALHIDEHGQVVQSEVDHGSFG